MINLSPGNKVKFTWGILIILLSGCSKQSTPPPIKFAPVINPTSTINSLISDHIDSVNEIQHRIKLHPEDTTLRYELAESYIASGQNNLGIQALWAATKIDPHYDKPLQALERYYQIINRMDLVFHILRMRVKAHSKDPSVYIQLGMTYINLHWLRDSDALVKIAGELDPDNVDYVMFHAQNEFFHNQTDNAINTLTHGLELHPGNIPISHLLAQYETVKLNRTKAIDILSDALAKHPTSQSLNLQISYYLLQTESQQSVSEALQRLLILKENGLDTAELFTRLGHAYQDSNNLTKAQDCYQKAVSINPGFEDCLFQLGRILIKNRNTEIDGENDIKEYQRILRNTASYNDAIGKLVHHPNSIPDHLNMAHLYSISNQPADAAIEYKKVLSLQPNNLSAQKGLKQALIVLKQHELPFVSR